MDRRTLVGAPLGSESSVPEPLILGGGRLRRGLEPELLELDARDRAGEDEDAGDDDDPGLDVEDVDDVVRVRGRDERGEDERDAGVADDAVVLVLRIA